MKTFKLNSSETILEDDYPIVFQYVYIVDNVFTRCDNFGSSTVAEWKHAIGAKEIRKCALFDHKGARLGDLCE